MATLLWDPWREVRRLREEASRLFDGASAFGLGEVEFPPVNVSRTPDHVVIEALLPSVDRDTLDVTAAGDKVTIKGERKPEPSVPEEKYHRRERAVGHFVRTIKLNERLAADQTKATYRDGLLRIELAYAPESRTHKVAVNN